MAVRWSRAAEADLYDLIDYGAQVYGLDQATDYAVRLRDGLELINANPLMSPLRHTVPPLRCHRHQAHLVFYDVVDNDILIVRVLHGRADWLAMLSPD